MPQSPRSHSKGESGAGLQSGLRLQAASPTPSSPGHDRTRETSPLADAAHAHSAGPRAMHRGAHRSAAVVWCHGRPTPATSGAGRPCGQSARAALAGGTGGQRAHAPMLFPAFRSAALALIHPIFARPGKSRSACWNVPVHLAKPTMSRTTDAQGPPRFLERLRGCTSAPQQSLCAPLPFPWAGKLEAPQLFPQGHVEQLRLCLTSRFPESVNPCP